MRLPIFIFALACALAPSAPFAQGALLEDFEALRTLPPRAYRATTPARFDLSGKLPAPRRQVDTSTCVSWSVTYAAASLALRGSSVKLALSPSFTYNQIARDASCQSSTLISRTLELLRTTGALPIDEFAFDAGFCGRMPTPEELSRAARYKINGWSAFEASSVETVKQQISNGVAVIFSIRTGPALRALKGDSVLDKDEATGEGHAMVVVGYDDAKRALKIQNSWGANWAADGYGWVSYDFWSSRVRTAFVIQ